MTIKVIKNNGEIDKLVANLVTDFRQQGKMILALPTGNTPLVMYQELVKKRIDWSKIKIFMLDVNYPQDTQEPTSFLSYIKTNLLDKINLPSENFNILNSQAENPDVECREYEAKIKAAGGLDLAVLGIGENGHIAYNEPGTDTQSLTHVANLSQQTIKTNRLKNQQGLTMGIKTIMKAKEIIVLAKGNNKAQAVKQAIEGPITLDCPASLLQNHSQVTYLLDQDAGRLLNHQS